MTKYVNTTDQVWGDAEVVGVKMERCLLWGGGHGIVSGLFRMPAGTRLPRHHHGGWVQILVLQGTMRVEQDGEEAHDIDSGGYYFVEPGEMHVETAVDDCLLLVTLQRDGPAHASTLVP